MYLNTFIILFSVRGFTFSRPAHFLAKTSVTRSGLIALQDDILALKKYIKRIYLAYYTFPPIFTLAKPCSFVLYAI